MSEVLIIYSKSYSIFISIIRTVISKTGDFSRLVNPILYDSNIYFHVISISIIKIYFVSKSKPSKNKSDNNITIFAIKIFYPNIFFDTFLISSKETALKFMPLNLTNSNFKPSGNV